MNWVKVFHLKNEEVVAINIINKSFKEVIEGIHKELECNFIIEVESESSIYVIKIEDIIFMEVRCTNEEN